MWQFVSQRRTKLFTLSHLYFGRFTETECNKQCYIWPPVHYIIYNMENLILNVTFWEVTEDDQWIWGIRGVTMVLHTG